MQIYRGHGRRSRTSPVTTSKNLRENLLLATLLHRRLEYHWSLGKEDPLAIDGCRNDVAGRWWGRCGAEGTRSRQRWGCWEVALAVSVQWQQNMLLMLDQESWLLDWARRCVWSKHGSVDRLLRLVLLRVVVHWRASRVWSVVNRLLEVHHMLGARWNDRHGQGMMVGMVWSKVTMLAVIWARLWVVVEEWRVAHWRGYLSVFHCGVCEFCLLLAVSTTDEAGADRIATMGDEPDIFLSC